MVDKATKHITGHIILKTYVPPVIELIGMEMEICIATSNINSEAGGSEYGKGDEDPNMSKHRSFFFDNDYKESEEFEY